MYYLKKVVFFAAFFISLSINTYSSGDNMYDNLTRVYNCDTRQESIVGEYKGYFNAPLFNTSFNSDNITTSFECPKTSFASYIPLNQMYVDKLLDGDDLYPAILAQSKKYTSPVYISTEPVGIEDVFVSGSNFIGLDVTVYYTSKLANWITDNRSYFAESDAFYGLKLDTKGFSDLDNLTIYTALLDLHIENNMKDEFSKKGLITLDSFINDGYGFLEDFAYREDVMDFKELEKLTIDGKEYSTGQPIPVTLYENSESLNCYRSRINSPVANNGIVSGTLYGERQENYSEFYLDCDTLYIYYRDSDGDGYGDLNNSVTRTSRPSGYVSDKKDFNDNNANAYPGAPEIADGIDNNGDGNIDEVFSIYYEDSDGDGYGNPNSSTQDTSQPAGYVIDNADCDDNNAEINPGATEIYDSIDNNCDGNTDEGAVTYYSDSDGDGYGDPGNSVQDASHPAGYVTNNTDCNDNNSDIYPGAPELADNKDNDCDNETDESLTMLVQTGQTVSYNAVGSVVTDNSTKDDGYYQAGAPRSYSRDNSTDIVTDETTGLMWQDDTDAASVKEYWDDAKTYCDNKSLGDYSDWRLPTMKELVTIVDYWRYRPAIDDTIFKNVQSYDYWSSVIHSNHTDSAWYINFSSGYGGYRNKTDYPKGVRCVRGDSLPESSFSRDNTSQVVTDETNGLMWQDNAEAASVKGYWEYAINYCESLTLGDYSDWRLPNINELRSIVDYGKYNPAIDDTIFENVNPAEYWSSTTQYENTNYAWYIYFDGSGDSGDVKDDLELNVRCVRGGQ